MPSKTVHPIDQFIADINHDQVLSETKSTTDHAAPYPIYVFRKDDVANDRSNMKWVDYSKQVGKCDRVRYFYQSQEKYDNATVMAVYKRKLYQLDTFYCAYTEQVCIYVD